MAIFVLTSATNDIRSRSTNIAVVFLVVLDTIVALCSKAATTSGSCYRWHAATHMAGDEWILVLGFDLVFYFMFRVYRWWLTFRCAFLFALALDDDDERFFDLVDDFDELCVFAWPCGCLKSPGTVSVIKFMCQFRHFGQQQLPSPPTRCVYFNLCVRAEPYPYTWVVLCVTM